MTAIIAPIVSAPVELSRLQFEGIVNDGSLRSMSLLLSAKELYKAELTDMPQDYIAALVFDSYHETLCVIDGVELLGGITYRCFRELGFVEIAFVAVRKDRASHGVGGQMMSHLKEWMRRRRIYHILACADLAAVGFFRKLGFNDEIVLPEGAYKGYIKEYLRVLLMECVITDAVPMLQTRQTLKLQLEAMVNVVASVCSDFTSVTPEGRREPGYQRPAAPASLRAASVVDLDAVVRYADEYRAVIEDAKAASPGGATLLDLSAVEARLANTAERPYYVTPYMFAADCRRAFRAARAHAGDREGDVAAIDAYEKSMLLSLGPVYRKWRAGTDAAAAPAAASGEMTA